MNLMYMLSAALIEYEVARVLRIVDVSLLLVLAIAMIAVVMMQKPVTGNIGTIAGEDTQTYAGQNKGKSKEQILRYITIGLAVAMAILAIFYFITFLEV
ncbi:MAG: preprotein translocase subunit SecG [Clostridiales bacterium]|nr:preprotein translocase subunit SecG [Clostridiales bacterium]